MRRLARLLPLVALLAACGSPAQDMENLCHASERSGASASQSAPERVLRTAEWVDETVRSSEVRAALAEYAQLEPGARGAFLRDLARRSGYSGPCPYADEVDAQDSGSAEP